MQIDTLDILTSDGSIEFDRSFLNIQLNDSLYFYPESKIEVKFKFKNFNLIHLNKYLPWEKNCHGYMSGIAGIEGNAGDISILSDMGNPPILDNKAPESIRIIFKKITEKLISVIN